MIEAAMIWNEPNNQSHWDAEVDPDWALFADMAIAAADATIDAYAGARYSLPLQTSVKVKTLSVDLAIYELEKRRRRVREVTQAARDAALAFLRDLALGRAVLDQPAGQPAQTSELDVKVPDDKGVFSDENLEDF